MIVRKYLVIVLFYFLYGCATTGMTPEQEAYFNEISNSNFDPVYSAEEIDKAWLKANEFWSATGLLKTATDDLLETHESAVTEASYKIKRVPQDNGFTIKIEVLLNNPFSISMAKRNVVLFYEYLEKGSLKYPELLIH
jgi:hypothetical protein